MDETHNNRTSLVKGAKDIAKETKRHAAKNLGKAVDRASDEYSAHRSYNRFQNEDEEENNSNTYAQQDGQYADNAANDEDGASSDATEGHDDEDEIYEGEYQGVPAYNDGKPREGQVALGQPVSDSQKSTKELETERQADEEELAQQYELIMQECGHGRFQWQLFFVLGLALMSDGVEVFVVGFVLPSAETDMCVPNSGAGWLGKDLQCSLVIKYPHTQLFVFFLQYRTLQTLLYLTCEDTVLYPENDIYDHEIKRRDWRANIQLFILLYLFKLCCSDVVAYSLLDVVTCEAD